MEGFPLCIYEPYLTHVAYLLKELFFPCLCVYTYMHIHVVCTCVHMIIAMTHKILKLTQNVVFGK